LNGFDLTAFKCSNALSDIPLFYTIAILSHLFIWFFLWLEQRTYLRLVLTGREEECGPQSAPGGSHPRRRSNAAARGQQIGLCGIRECL